MVYKDIFGDGIELSDERWEHIIKEHPEVEKYKAQIHEVLAKPEYVKKSRRDPEVSLYYKFYKEIFNGKYLLVAVRKGERPFILTYYITDVVKKGETLWEKS